MNLEARVRSIFHNVYNYLKTLTVKKVFILWCVFAAGIVAFVLVLFFSVWLGVLGSVPNRQDLLDIKNPTASEVYSADSVLLGKYFFQERSNVLYEDIPKHVIDAAIVTEDVRFYEHNGIDVRSLGRVLVKTILFQQESSGGGSTITQQLAKNLYPRKNYWFFSLLINKMREMIIAARLEDAYDKETILTLYLNTIPFGDNTFGLGAASQRFFSIRVGELSVDQGALLVGMLKATYSYNPRIYPERAVERRNVVLSQMEKYGIFDTDSLEYFQALPIELKYNKITHHTGLAPYFREYLRTEMLAWCEQYNQEHEEKINLYTDGLKIYTTIDSRLQQHAEQAMEKQMAAIQKTFLNHWGRRDPWQHYPGMMDEIIKRSDRYKKLRQQGLSHEETIAEMNKALPMNIFTWEGEKETVLSPIDSIKHYLKFLNAGVLAVDPSQGAIRAWVGGINHHYFQYDHVRESTKRQVGSVFKPVVYASALEQGVRPCTFISAEKTTYTNMEDWSPENTEDNYGLKYSMPGALARSVNTVSVRVLEKAGIDNTINVARKMGIESTLNPVPSLALGTAEISVMEMVGAFACFANNGKSVKPFYITSIVSHENEVLEEFKPAESHQAISEESAALMLHMLRRVVEEGTGSGLRSRFGLTNDIAGKTGTTQSNTDGWFIAVMPRLVIGAWVGADDARIRFRSTALGQGARTALPIVGEFIRSVNQDEEVNYIVQERFAELPFSLRNKIDCPLYKEDNNLLKRLFGKREKERKKEFGKKEKKGFFKRLFERSEEPDTLERNP